MPLSLKIKSALVILLTVLGILITPAEAEAPHVHEEELHEAFIDPKAYAYRVVLDSGWNVTEFRCLEKLWQKESNWRYKADNPNSTAFGIAQILGETATHPAEQIENGIRYIIHRYDTPCNAWEFWKRHY